MDPRIPHLSYTTLVSLFGAGLSYIIATCYSSALYVEDNGHNNHFIAEYIIFVECQKFVMFAI